jgi:CheY-like chemotaxis protein
MGDDPSSDSSFSKSPPRSRDDTRRGSGVHDIRPKRLHRETFSKAPPAGRERLRRSILIVDGSPATLDAIAELLRDNDFTVLTADGVGEMERVCRAVAEPPELALLEFHLRDGRGDRAAAWLRARWAHLPIVYSSCLRPEDDGGLEAALLAPATALLLKPTSLNAILQAVAPR